MQRPRAKQAAHEENDAHVCGGRTCPYEDAEGLMGSS